MLKDRFRILGVCSGQFKDEKTGRQVLYGKVEVLRALSERETKPAGYLFPAQVVEVNRHLRTSDGMDVDRQEKGTYLIRDTGEQLSSDDPKAL